MVALFYLWNHSTFKVERSSESGGEAPRDDNTPAGLGTVLLLESDLAQNIVTTATTTTREYLVCNHHRRRNKGKTRSIHKSNTIYNAHRYIHS